MQKASDALRSLADKVQIAATAINVVVTAVQAAVGVGVIA